MTILWRALVIIYCCCYYRLDELLPKALPWPARVLLGVFPKGTASRGLRLRRACEDLGPVFVKFGQLLSTRPDLIPADIVAELNQLQDNVPPFSSAVFQRQVAAQLRRPLDQIFVSFDQTPLASASVAQVHSAQLQTDKDTVVDVVVKIIRPGIERTIDKDMQLLLWLAKRVENSFVDGRRLRPVAVVEDYRATLFDELDLQREAANASQLRRNFLNSPLLYIPDVFWDYCTANVLVMERIYGIPVSDLDALSQQQTSMKRLAERGVEIFFTQVFEHNFFHADMHPGNIFVSTKNPDNPQYIAVDMAVVGSLSRADQYYLARNLLAMFRRDYRQVAELHIQSGWVPKDTRVNEFEAAVRTVCEPIFEKPLAEISFASVLLNLFSTARRFNMEVQPQLVLLQKTLLNIEGLGRQLYPQLDLWQTAHPFLERWLKNRFHPKTLYKELKRYGPEWMEKFPQVPMQLFNNLEKLQALGELTPELQRALSQRDGAALRKKRLQKKYLSVASLLGLSAAFTLSPPLQIAFKQLSVPGAGFLLLALAVLLLR
ncbi:MAG: ubiquinone biosynthesis regulatory protein kinase UbiB [Cellvibrionaceae bacterium]|nr:ubiquinone biosynthesis regulatory protein kinase UbiB [Cellvibrionaceae bacterium]